MQFYYQLDIWKNEKKTRAEGIASNDHAYNTFYFDIGLHFNIGRSITGDCIDTCVIRELGGLVGKGAVLSVTLVLLVLPAFLYYFDTIIQKTMWKKKK